MQDFAEPGFSIGLTPILGPMDTGIHRIDFGEVQ
jgi:hypothetical protein